MLTLPPSPPRIVRLSIKGGITKRRIIVPKRISRNRYRLYHTVSRCGRDSMRAYRPAYTVDSTSKLLGVCSGGLCPPRDAGNIPSSSGAPQPTNRQIALSSCTARGYLSTASRGPATLQPITVTAHSWTYPGMHRAICGNSWTREKRHNETPDRRTGCES